MKAPENMLVKMTKQARWVERQQFLILCQFYPDNPIWVIRPHFIGHASKPVEPVSPRMIAEQVNEPKALEGARRWLGANMNSEYRARGAWVQTLNGNLTPEAKARSSKPVQHITKLYESLSWPRNIGMIFPEGLNIIAHQVKKIWLPEPLADISILEGYWKRYDFDSHIEYARLR